MLARARPRRPPPPCLAASSFPGLSRDATQPRPPLTSPSLSGPPSPSLLCFPSHDRTEPPPPTRATVATGHPTPYRRPRKLRPDPLFLPTDPRPSGSPAASPSSSPPTFGRRRTFEDSRAPAPPRPRRCLHQIRCELLFHSPSSSRSFPYSSRPFHQSRLLLAAGHAMAVTTATAARSRAHRRAHRNLRNPKHLTTRPPVHRSAGPANPRAPAAASVLAAVISGDSKASDRSARRGRARATPWWPSRIHPSPAAQVRRVAAAV